MSFLGEVFANNVEVLYLQISATTPPVFGAKGLNPTETFYTPNYVPLALTPMTVIRGPTGSILWEAAFYESKGKILSVANTGSNIGADSDFFQSVMIVAPSFFNSDYRVVVNGAFSFVPQFITEVPPALFSGGARDGTGALPPYQFAQFWTFGGALYTSLSDYI